MHGRGGRTFFPRTSRRAESTLCTLANGLRNVMISHKRIASEYTSAGVLYGSLFMTSCDTGEIGEKGACE